MTRLNFSVSGWTASLDDKTLAYVNLACMAGAKREGGGGREKRAKVGKREGRVPFPLSPIPLAFSLPPYPLYPLDACYAGKSELCS